MINARIWWPLVALVFISAIWPVASSADQQQDLQYDQPETLAGSELTAQLLRRFGWQASATLPDEAGLADYIGYALAHSPAVTSALASWQAAGEVGAQVSALPDPRFAWGEFLVPVETRLGPQQRVFSLSQTLPWFGTQSLRGKIASDHALAAEARLSGVVLKLLFRVRNAYYELAYLGEAARITDGHLALVEQWEAVARARYKTGAGNFADLLKAQIEAEQLSERLRELEDARGPAAVEFNAALGRPLAVTMTWPQALPAETEAVAEDSLVTALLQRHPELLALQSEELGGEHAVALADKQKFPDLSLGLDYIVIGPAIDPTIPDSGQDAVVARLALNVPIWWGKYDAAEREAAGRRRALEAARQAAADNLRSDLARARFQYREAARNVELYGGTLMVRGRQALDAVRAAYQSGQAGYVELVEAQRTLLAFELTEARARADRLISLARIEALVAGPVPTVTGH